MRRIEIDTTIDERGNIHMPEAYQDLYGARVRILVSPADTEEEIPTPNPFDPMKYSNTVNWPDDGLTYQRKLREEWD
jgi:hypothetical protein